VVLSTSREGNNPDKKEEEGGKEKAAVFPFHRFSFGQRKQGRKKKKRKKREDSETFQER